MKNITYILLSLLLVFAGCRKVDKVETYQIEVGETTVTAGTDNVSVEATYTYDYTLKSARLQYSDNSGLENAVSLAAQFDNGVLKATATGLKPATAYFYRFELDNGITKMWTETGTFRTLDEPIVTKLIVTTAEVSGIADTYAVCGGEVVSEGGSKVIARGVCYGLSENPSLDNCTGKTVDGGGLSAFTSTMTGLEKETKYYVRAYATDNDTTCYGEQKIFTTLGQIVYSLPTVITNTVDETTVGQYSAMLSGVVTDDGNKPVTGCGFWYGTSHDTLGGITRPAAYSAGGFSLNVSDGIEPGTTYYARAYAENELGRRLGNEVSFTTLSIPLTPDPQVFTLSSADVTTNSATIKGRIYYDGTENPIKKGFLYGTDVNDMNSDIDCTSQTDPFEAELTGLTPNTTYYYEAYAIFTGYPQTFYGGIESFRTLIEITEPTIQTVSPSNITTTTANSGGYGITDGNSPIVNKGVCWATFENPTLEDCLGHTENGTGTADFISEVTGLEPGTSYYVRAYAVNQAGKTGYGEAKGFVTMQEETGNYFCITALDAGTTTVSMANEGYAPTVYLEYKKNNGTWTTFTVGSTNISLSQNDTVYFKAPYGQPNNKFGLANTRYNHFVIGGGNVDVSGNIMYLLDPTGNKITLTSANSWAFASLFYECDKLVSANQLSLPATTLADNCYSSMFESCASLTAAPDLPATTLADNCYSSMFESCTSLTAAPDLPATTLAQYCYEGMFRGCTSLTAVPDLSATTLARYCCQEMFNDCISLATAPDLPATTLAQCCYSNMFRGCTSLTAAPDLPATTLAPDCYEGMFRGCTSLTAAPDLPATILAYSCYSNMFRDCTSLTATPDLTVTTLADLCYCCMFSGCTSLTAAPILPATTLAQFCYSNMFCDCTSLTAAPVLPVTTLANGCYGSMFSGCTSLTTAPILPATTLANGCYESMFFGCTSLTTAPILPATTLADGCYSHMFYDCTSLTAAPDLPVTTLADNCYSNMFHGCTRLTAAPVLPATTLAESCYEFMFCGCTRLTAAPVLPATTLAQNCYYGMFQSCTRLTTAPILPATTLADGCYNSMFESCTSLTTAPVLPATTLATDCYNSMFYVCKNLTTAPDLPATTLAERCYHFMFRDCTSLTAAPDLPATTLADKCYAYMFADCTLLMAAPDLPATTLADGCYQFMFQNCTSLTTAPDLPATTLAEKCYSKMFLGCSNLHHIRMLATENLNATDALYEWVSEVPSTGDFYKKAGANLPSGINGIPYGWTVHNE